MEGIEEIQHGQEQCVGEDYSTAACTETHASAMSSTSRSARRERRAAVPCL